MGAPDGSSGVEACAGLAARLPEAWPATPGGRRLAPGRLLSRSVYVPRPRRLGRGASGSAATSDAPTSSADTGVIRPGVAVCVSRLGQRRHGAQRRCSQGRARASTGNHRRRRPSRRQRRGSCRSSRRRWAESRSPQKATSAEVEASRNPAIGVLELVRLNCGCCSDPRPRGKCRRAHAEDALTVPGVRCRRKPRSLRRVLFRHGSAEAPRRAETAVPAGRPRRQRLPFAMPHRVTERQRNRQSDRRTATNRPRERGSARVENRSAIRAVRTAARPSAAGVERVRWPTTRARRGAACDTACCVRARRPRAERPAGAAASRDGRTRPLVRERNSRSSLISSRYDRTLSARSPSGEKGSTFAVAASPGTSTLTRQRSLPSHASRSKPPSRLDFTSNAFMRGRFSGSAFAPEDQAPGHLRWPGSQRDSRGGWRGPQAAASSHCRTSNGLYSDFRRPARAAAQASSLDG